MLRCQTAEFHRAAYHKKTITSIVRIGTAIPVIYRLQDMLDEFEPHYVPLDL